MSAVITDKPQHPGFYGETSIDGTSLCNVFFFQGHLPSFLSEGLNECGKRLWRDEIRIRLRDCIFCLVGSWICLDTNWAQSSAAESLLSLLHRFVGSASVRSLHYWLKPREGEGGSPMALNNLLVWFHIHHMFGELKKNVTFFFFCLELPK